MYTRRAAHHVGDGDPRRRRRLGRGDEPRRGGGRRQGRSRRSRCQVAYGSCPSTTLQQQPPNTGAQVEARFQGGATWYKAVVTQQHADGRCDLLYDDGDREERVRPEHIKRLDNAAAGAGAGGDDDDDEEDKVGLDELWAALAHGAEQMLDPTTRDAPASTAVRDFSLVSLVC